jgi:hypothetical protein
MTLPVRSLLSGMLLLAATPAAAQLTISAPSMFTNGSWRDEFNDDGTSFFTIDQADFRFQGPGGLPSLDIDLNSYTTQGGGFFFLHNLTAKGGGTATMTTVLSFTITNNTSTTQFLRFDSMITPGHIALQGSQSSNLALFNFAVNQTVGSNTSQLYWARGYVDTDSAQPDVVETSDGVAFAGFSSYTSNDRIAYDWGATPLNLNLNPILPGQTHTLRYTSTTYASAGGVCLTELGCEGVQVAFGDPRNDGSSVSQRLNGQGGLSPLSLSLNQEPLIGRDFGTYEGFVAQIVDLSAPLPPALPAPPPPPDYSWLPAVDSVAAVPEPRSWLMLLAGFGLVGTMLRRQTGKTASA